LAADLGAVINHLRLPSVFFEHLSKHRHQQLVGKLAQMRHYGATTPSA
jgi:hypothetical protein